MDTAPGTIWGREPAMVLALVQAVIAVVVAFGLTLAPDQIGAILAVICAGRSRGRPRPARSTSSLPSSPPAAPWRRQRPASESGRAPRSATWRTCGPGRT